MKSLIGMPLRLAIPVHPSVHTGGLFEESGLCPKPTPLVAALVFPVVEERRGGLETKFVRKMELFAQLGDGHVLLEMCWGLLQVARVLPVACVRHPRGGVVAAGHCAVAVLVWDASVL